MSSRHQYALNLLDLPIDILGSILQPLLTEPKQIPLCICRDARTIPNLSRHALTALLIHPSLYAIGRPILYDTNEFELDLTRTHMSHVRNGLQISAAHKGGDGIITANANDQDAAINSEYSTQQVRDMGLLRVFAMPSSRKKISRLHIRMDKLRGWVQDLIVPMLAEMIINGNLADLSFTIGRAQEAHTPSRTTIKESPGRKDQSPYQQLKLFTLPPLQGILAVLSDPYLRTARLFVAGESHSQEWCRFHEADVPCGNRENIDKIEIDWRRILEQLDMHPTLAID